MVLGDSALVLALSFSSSSHGCKIAVSLWAHQEAAECRLAVTGLEAGRDPVQRWEGREGLLFLFVFTQGG